MSLKRLLNVDAGLSVLLHALKALVALFLNWLVLHHFAVDDFVVWSVTSSILIVATASDLGIGQYTVTQLIGSKRDEWPRHVGQGLAALLPLATIAGMFVLLAVDGPSRLYSATMATLIALRILTLPFVAVLHAENQFKVRKALELAAYLVAAALVGAIAVAGANVYLALVALNATFLLGFATMVGAASRFISLGASLRGISLARSARVFRAALPFTLNNLAGVLSYGGFIWLSSLILPKEEVAKLAILHSFVLVNLYQIYDVFLKSRQADLADVFRLSPYRKLNVVIMLALPPAFLILGRQTLALISGSQVHLTLVEAALYALFVSFELGNLFVQSITQVNLSQVDRLTSYSAIRGAMMTAFVAAGLLPLGSEAKLLTLLSLLTLGSLVSFLHLYRTGHETASSQSGVARASAEPCYQLLQDEL